MRHYKPYPAYKDSGVEWIGRVPDHWAVAPVKAVAQVVNGATPESGNPIYWDGDIAWFTPADLDNESATDLLEPRRKITEEGLASCAARLTPIGSVVLSIRAPVGSVGVTRTPSATNQGCRTLVPKTRVPARFLAETLVAARSELALRSNGTTFQELSTDSLASLRVPLPPFAEQIAIAAALDRETARIDALIAKKTRFIELLKEKRQALITHAVTKGLDPNVKVKDSGVEWIGDVPEHWAVSRLGHFAAVENGTTPSRANEAYWVGGDVAWLGSGEVNQVVVTEATEHITALALRECSLRLLPKGTVVVGMVGQGKTRGLAAILGIDATINQNMAAVCTGPKLNGLFLLHVFTAAYEWLREGGRGSNQAALNCELLGEFRLAVPPDSEQQKIVAHIADMTKRLDSIASKTEHSMSLLKERRSALITAAVTGQINLLEVA